MENYILEIGKDDKISCAASLDELPSCYMQTILTPEGYSKPTGKFSWQPLVTNLKANRDNIKIILNKAIETTFVTVTYCRGDRQPVEKFTLKNAVLSGFSYDPEGTDEVSLTWHYDSAEILLQNNE